MDFLTPALYKFTPGMVFTSTFLVGDLVGVSSSDVTHTRSNPAAAPSNPDPTNPTEHEWTLNLSFANNAFTAGDIYRFNVGRKQQQDATVPQGLTNTGANAPGGVITGISPGVSLFRADHTADLLGDGVFIPEDPIGTNIQPGMTFNGTIVDGANTIPFSGRIKNRIGHGYSVLDGFGFINAEAATAATLPVAGVASRKTHGAAGNFDIPLPTSGPAGIECRSGGANNDYTLVFTFDRPVASSGNVTVTQGSATVSPAPTGGSNPSIAANPNQITVNLTNVTNAQHLIVTLSNVRDTSGATFPDVAARMDVLVGDTTADHFVDSADISQTKSVSGAAVGSANFREDVNTDGFHDSADIGFVKSKSGTALP